MPKQRAANKPVIVHPLVDDITNVDVITLSFKGVSTLKRKKITFCPLSDQYTAQINGIP